MTNRIWFETLGCKANRYDTERVRTALTDLGWTLAPAPEAAELVVVNTCAVTAEAERKSRQALRRAGRLAPAARVVALGCLVKALELRDEEGPAGVLALADSAGDEGLARLLTALGHPGAPLPRAVTPFRDRVRAFIKVQDGCDNHCTYCIIPHLRGPSRSRRAEEILAEAAGLAAAGVPELVLTGVCLGDWREEDRGLADLIRDLTGLAGTFRLRLSSLEPEHTDRALLQALAASPRVCPHLHLPLQAGSDRVLKRMGRRYRRADYLALVTMARELLPDLALTTDVITGFPGESDQDFDHTLELVRRCSPTRLHVFPFSPRAGTAATRLDGVLPQATVRERAARLRELGGELALAAARERIGAREQVVLEGDGQGWSGRYQRVLVEGDQGPAGRLVTTEIIANRGPELVGRLISSP